MHLLKKSMVTITLVSAVLLTATMVAIYSDIVLGDSLGDPLSFTVSGTDISVVPLPGAIWLFCTGLGIMGIRRPGEIEGQDCLARAYGL